MADSPAVHQVSVDVPRGDSDNDSDGEDAGVGALQRDLELAEQEFHHHNEENDNDDHNNNDNDRNHRRAPPRHADATLTNSSAQQPQQSVRVSTVSTATAASDSDLYGVSSSLGFQSVVEVSGGDDNSRSTVRSPDRRRYLRHQATSLTGATKIDWYDEDLLHRAVADAGRWAYGTIFVEVWLLSQDKLTLVRPHQGWWIDPVHHNQFHPKTPKTSLGQDKETSPKLSGPRAFLQRMSSSASVRTSIVEQQRRSKEQQDLACPICRLTVEKRPDYLEPAPMVPGEGLPGVLWQDDNNPHFLADRNSTRGGSTRGSLGATFFVGGSRRGGGGGSSRGGFLFPQMQKMYQEGQSAGLSEESASPRGAAADTQRGVSTRPSASPNNSTKAGSTRSFGKKASSEPVVQNSPARPFPIHTRGHSDDGPSPHHHRGHKRDRMDDILLSVPAAPDGTAQSGRSSGRGGGNKDTNQQRTTIHRHRFHHHAHQPKVVWRNIQDLANDPDSPWNPRLQHMSDSVRLGWAAAVPIRHEGEKQGIVIYMARSGVDMNKLKNPTNEAYLVAASNLISAALIIRTPRHDAMKERKQESSDMLKRIRKRILEARAAGIPLDELVRQNVEKRKQEEAQGGGEASRSVSSEQGHSWAHYQWGHFATFMETQFERLWTKLGITLHKCLALSSVKPPPAANWRQSIHNFAGVFVMLLTLTNINTALQKAYGSKASLLLGPFGALATLLYGLTAAPASQPRNAILGQTYSVCLARILRYIPLSVWSTETRVSLTVALSVAGMTKFGWTHPPAGAAALLFAANDSQDWSNVGVLLMGNVIAILMASLINNWSAKRQYPSSWGFRYGYNRVENWVKKEA